MKTFPYQVRLKMHMADTGMYYYMLSNTHTIQARTEKSAVKKVGKLISTQADVVIFKPLSEAKSPAKKSPPAEE